MNTDHIKSTDTNKIQKISAEKSNKLILEKELENINKEIDIDPSEKNLHKKFSFIFRILRLIKKHSHIWIETSHDVENDELIIYYDEKVSKLNDFYEKYSTKQEFFKEGSTLIDRILQIKPRAKYYYEKALFIFEFKEYSVMESNKDIRVNLIENYSLIDELTLESLDSIKKSIRIKPSNEKYLLKSNIERSLKRNNDALNSLNLALKIKYEISTLQVMISLLIETGRDEEAFRTIEDVLKNTDDPEVEEELLRDKLYLLYKNNRYEQYAKLLSKLYIHNPSNNIIVHLVNLFKQEQYANIIEHISYKKHHSHIIKWFNMWSYIGIDKVKEAREILNELSFTFIVEEIENISKDNLTKEKNVVKRNNIKKLDIENIGGRGSSYVILYILFSVALLDKISIPFFIELLTMIYHPFYYEDQITFFHDCLEGMNDETGFSRKPANIIIKDSKIIAKKDWDYDHSVMIDLLNFYFSLEHVKFGKEKSFSGEDIAEELINRILNIQEERRIERLKNEEKNRILSNLSHSIKNMLRAVIDPLKNLRLEFPERSNTIDNAIRGAHLLREMVNAIQFSYNSSLEDLSWDIENPGHDSVTLHTMIENSLVYSISNMFDFRYFSAFSVNYYPRSMRKDDYDKIRMEWLKIISKKDISDVIHFAENNMFKISLDLNCISEHMVGNEKGSAIKLMILFQEIIFNAVKYASFVNRIDRFLNISFSSSNDKLVFRVENSYNNEIMAKSTGLGKVIIENFAKILNCEPSVKRDDKIYSISLTFNNFWRNNGQSIIH